MTPDPQPVANNVLFAGVSVVRDPWLLAMCAARVLTYAIFMVYAACLAVLREQWHMSASQAGTISGGFMFGYAISLVIFSWLAQRFGAKSMFVLSALLTAVAALAFGLFARSYTSALVLYTFTAAMQGGTYPPAIMLFADRYRPTQRGSAVGFLIASTSVGYAFSLLLSGALLWHGGYELAFTVTGCLPLAGAIISCWVLRHTPNLVHKSVGGTTTVMALRGNANAQRLILGYVSHCWEVLGMWSWTPAFLTASLTLSGVISIQAAAFGAYLSAVLHVGGALASSSMGWVSDRFGRRRLLLVLASASTMLSFILGWLVTWPIAILIVVALLYAFTSLGDSPVLSTALTEAVAPAHLGSALALRSLLGFAAGAVSPIVFGLVLDMSNASGGSPTIWGWAFVALGLGGMGAVWCAHGLTAVPEQTASHYTRVPYR
jgi:MFS family permease